MVPAKQPGFPSWARSLKLRYGWLASLIVSAPIITLAQLQLVPDTQPQQALAGERRQIRVVWQNPGRRTAKAPIRLRILQASSATVVPLEETAWKDLEVLPLQTVVENVLLNFPNVRAETPFLLQWFEDTNHVLGQSKVLVYPTNLLEQLRTLGEDVPVGVLDPQNQIKPLLKNLRIEFVDLAGTGPEHFSGRFAIIGPFAEVSQMHKGLASQLQVLATNGTGVVWLLPPPEKNSKLQPSFYFVPEKQVAIVIAQGEMVANLPQSPQAQLNLVHFCKLALNPVAPGLPYSNP